MTASDWAANASLSSTTARSSSFHPARSSAIRIAGAGPIPIRRGSTPAAAHVTTLASGSTPSCSQPAPETSSSAAAPSLSGLEFPAVTVPSAAKTGRRPASRSSVESDRGPSSTATDPPSASTTGTSSPSNRPDRWAASARSWLPNAKRSWASRVIEYSAASTSAVMPRLIVCSGGISGLTRRQPSAVSTSS